MNMPRKSITCVLFCVAALSLRPEDAPPVPANSPTAAERIQALEAKVASLEQMVGILAEQLLTKEGRYMLRAGVSGARVAEKFKLTFSELMRLNPGVRWDRLNVGQIVGVREISDGGGKK